MLTYVDKCRIISTNIDKYRHLSSNIDKIDKYRNLSTVIDIPCQSASAGSTSAKKISHRGSLDGKFVSVFLGQICLALSFFFFIFLVKLLPRPKILDAPRCLDRGLHCLLHLTSNRLLIQVTPFLKSTSFLCLTWTFKDGLYLQMNSASWIFLLSQFAEDVVKISHVKLSSGFSFK